MDTHDSLYHRSTSNPSHKKRNVERACDACRRRKTKPVDLAHTTAVRYITGLEDRMEQLRALLKQLRPNVDFSQQLGPPVIRDSWKDQAQQPLWANTLPVQAKASPPASSPQTTEEPDHDSSEDPGAILDILELPNNGEMTQKLELRGEEPIAQRDPTEPAIARFHGKSSSVGLVGVTQMFKMMHLLEANTAHDTRLGSPDSIGSSSSGGSATSGSSIHRPKFWKMPERERLWEERDISSADLIAQLLAAFPPEDLVPELIRVYFVYSNSPLPLLHRPTFDRQWSENLHRTNVWFAVVCLGIFSIASRWSHDLRVIPEGATTSSGSPDWSLAGWKYCKVGLGLFAAYLRDSAHRPLTWILVGSALRKAQDIGIHKKRVYGREPTVDSELWKRAFYCLLVLDRFESAAIGRCALVGEEDFDVDLPLEVDDEYWEADGSGSMFKQPEDVPASKVVSFNLVIKLSRVLAFAMKSLYAIDKQKLFFGLSPLEWRRAILEHVGAALEKWFKTLPEDFVWLNQKDSSPFAVDAAVLRTTYRLVEMLIYQMFIPTSVVSSTPYEPLQQAWQLPPGTTPLDICVDAAHDCANISQKQSLEALSTWPIYIYASQVGSTLILVKIWNLKMQDRDMRARDVEDVKPPTMALEPLYSSLRVFLRIFELAEARWGFMAPYLQELRRALPEDIFEGTSVAAVQPRGDLRYESSPVESNADFPDINSRGLAPQERVSPSYPSPAQQSSNRPWMPYYVSPNALSQPRFSESPPYQTFLQRSSRRSSYPSSLNLDLPESSYETSVPPSQLSPAWNESDSVSRLDQRPRLFLPSGDFAADHPLRRQSANNLPLAVAPNHEYSPSNSNYSGRPKYSDGLKLPYPSDQAFDRSKVYSSAPPLPRTLHPARSLSYLGNPAPFSSHDTSLERSRDRQNSATIRPAQMREHPHLAPRNSVAGPEATQMRLTSQTEPFPSGHWLQELHKTITPPPSDGIPSRRS
ncbi:hypothetical protein H0H93_007351 [Arthromyces matolae]|nr:hypothetical protein H0H93_007351 [Arthromyces matolae]